MVWGGAVPGHHHPYGLCHHPCEHSGRRHPGRGPAPRVGAPRAAAAPSAAIGAATAGALRPGLHLPLRPGADRLRAQGQPQPDHHEQHQARQRPPLGAPRRVCVPRLLHASAAVALQPQVRGSTARLPRHRGARRRGQHGARARHPRAADRLSSGHRHAARAGPAEVLDPEEGQPGARGPHCPGFWRRRRPQGSPHQEGAGDLGLG
mmetsp:Transcript_27738/g.65909  ORF Transcript_27738/g.65909 Transcript_27738/m.65909 type:complete len:206 (+) Transcript_27738:520-1137(+)